MATRSIPEKNPDRGKVEDLKFLGGILKKYNKAEKKRNSSKAR